MKNYIVTIVCILTNWSCTDEFLDQEPITDLTTEDVFSSATNLEVLVQSAYQPMRYEFDGTLGDSYSMSYIYTDVRSDDAIIENHFFQPHSHGFEDFVSLESTNVNIRGIWSKFFNGVSRSNTVIRGLTNLNEGVLDEGTRSLYLAEARFLRAYYYFELVKNFGEVPLSGDGEVQFDVTNPESVKRKPIPEVYAQIENDLELAKSDLPAARVEGGRATLGAALGLLSKVYLYQQKWQLAMNEAQAIVDLGIYELEENFADNFKITNEFGKESIFEIDFRNTFEGGLWNLTSQTSLSLQFFGPNFSGTTLTGWSYNLITPELRDAFINEGDIERKNATIMFEGQTFESQIMTDAGFNPIPNGFFDEWINSEASDGQKYGDDFAYSLKYFLTPEELETYSPGLQASALNHKILRYAEVLLILAEAELNGAISDGLSGQDAFNMVRSRAGLANKTLTMEALKLERRLELASEGNRFHDLVRWGDAAAVLNGFTVGRDELLPIPLFDILLTGSDSNGENILTQNSGY